MTRFQNPQAEVWVLGALMDAEGPVLRSNARALLDASGLTPEDFTRPDLAAYFRAAVKIAEGGRPADPQTIFSVCRGLPGVGPEKLEWLRNVQGANAANREAFATHCESIRHMSQLRRLAAFHAAQLAALEKPEPNAQELTTKAEAFLQSFAANTQVDQSGSGDITALADDWDAFDQGIRQPYLPTGIEVLDSVLGGFVPNLNVVGGLPSVGKSAFIAEFIQQALKRGMRLGLFGLEDATKWFAKRHIARGMGLAVGQVAAVPRDDAMQERFAVVANEQNNLSRNLQTYNRAGIDPATLVQTCKHWVLNRGVQAIVIDHGGEVVHESAGPRDRHDLAVAATYKALRDLAINQQVPIVVLCHFNRETERLQSGVPRLSNFAETRYIEAMSRVALGLWQKEGDPRLRCTVLKRTEGQRGVTVAIERDETHALVKAKGGEVLDLAAEAQAERAAEHMQRQLERRAKRPAPTWGEHEN